jgi:hypothetical protein
MKWLKNHHRQTGVALVVGYLMLQAAIFYFYNFLPAHPATWTSAVVEIAPSIAGLTQTSDRLAIEGERLSFVMAGAYLPGVLLGIFAAVRELASAPLVVRPKWQDALACVGGLVFLVGLHYLGYWQKQYYRNSFQLMHPLIAVFMPFLIGFFACAVAFRCKQLFSSRPLQSR